MRGQYVMAQRSSGSATSQNLSALPGRLCRSGKNFPAVGGAILGAFAANSRWHGHCFVGASTNVNGNGGRPCRMPAQRELSADEAIRLEPHRRKSSTACVDRPPHAAGRRPVGAARLGACRRRRRRPPRRRARGAARPSREPGRHRRADRRAQSPRLPHRILPRHRRRPPRRPEGRGGRSAISTASRR